MATLERVGLWAALLVLFLAWARDYLVPRWFDSQEKRETREREQDDRAWTDLKAVYERFIAQQQETLVYIGQNTEALRTLQGAMTAQAAQSAKQWEQSSRVMEQVLLVLAGQCEATGCPLAEFAKDVERSARRGTGPLGGKKDGR